MIEIAGMHPKALGSMAPGRIDGPIQQIGAEALADEIGDQPEIGELDLGIPAAIEFRIAGGRAGDIEYVDLDARVMDGLGEHGIVKGPSLVPEPRLTHRVVKVAIEVHRHLLRLE